MKATQKLRIIINGISFYSTPKKVREGIGDFQKVNRVIQAALEHLTTAQKARPTTSGVGHTYEGVQVQIDVIY